jgi:hypothetical protein
VPGALGKQCLDDRMLTRTGAKNEDSHE